jgi:Domain of unknown function (DUF222)
MFDTNTPFDLLPPRGSRPAPVVDPLIADLDWLPTGIMLSAALDRVDRARLSGHERVSLLKARARQIAHDQAELLADIQSVSESVSELANHPDPDDQDIFDTTASEISAALCLTRRASEVQTGLAETLCVRLPQVWKALSEGVIDLARARVLSDQTIHLPDELARKVCDQALERASAQTTGQLRARIQRLIISMDPAAAKDRYEKKLTERKVVCEPTDAGTAKIHGFDLPADRANQAMCRINRLAKTAKQHGDRRGIDQIRADIFIDLLNGNQIGDSTVPGTVDIRVDLTTLLELDDQPGEIPGYGPVIADVTRQVVSNSHQAEWRFGISHLDQLIDLVTTRRRPTKAQKDLIQVQDPECVFITCRQDSNHCDIDHTLPWAQHHHTTVTELDPLCSHHNQVKEHGWKLTKTRPGTYTWTSPLGHTYTTGPDPP